MREQCAAIDCAQRATRPHDRRSGGAPAAPAAHAAVFAIHAHIQHRPPPYRPAIDNTQARASRAAIGAEWSVSLVQPSGGIPRGHHPPTTANTAANCRGRRVESTPPFFPATNQSDSLIHDNNGLGFCIAFGVRRRGATGHFVCMCRLKIIERDQIKKVEDKSLDCLKNGRGEERRSAANTFGRVALTLVGVTASPAARRP